MKISIIMATYNVASTIKSAMDSVFSQSYPDIELLVADGGSTDGTIEILKNCKNDRLSWWISENDSGIYDAWNKALQYVNGDWIIFMGADDELWSESALAKFVESASKIDEKYPIIYGKVAQTCSNGDVWNMAGKPWDHTKTTFRYKAQMFAHQGIFHHRSLFENGNKFDATFKIAGDYDFLLHVLKNQDAVFLPELIVAKMQSDGASGGFNNQLLLSELLRARRQNGYNNNNIWVYSLRLRYWLRDLIIKYLGFNLSKTINDYLRIMMGKPKLPS